MAEALHEFGNKPEREFICRNNKEKIFFVYKLDELHGKGIAGAEFVLEEFCGTGLKYAVSDLNGRAEFSIPLCCRAILWEVNPPIGYIADKGRYRILADGCGTLFVNGCATAAFAIFGQRKIEVE